MNSDFFLSRMQGLHHNNRLPQALSVTHSLTAQRLQLATDFSKITLCPNASRENAFCNTCDTCKKIEKSNHPDVYVYQPEKKEIPVDDIKRMQKWIQISPHEGKLKILHLHQAHTLNASSSNALLKTLEEPPYFSHILLWSENQSRLLPTLLSRSVKCNLQTSETQHNEPAEIPSWSDQLQTILENKGSSALEDIFSFSKSIAKQKDTFHYFFSTLNQHLKTNFATSVNCNNALHINRLENFHELLQTAENQLLIRYGNAQVWIERLLIEWKMLWNLKKK